MLIRNFPASAGAPSQSVASAYTSALQRPARRGAPVSAAGSARGAALFFMYRQPAAPDEGQKNERRNYFESGEPQTRRDHEQIRGTRREARTLQRERHRSLARTNTRRCKYRDEAHEVRARENCYVVPERARRVAEHALGEEPEGNSVHEPRHTREDAREQQHAVREWPQ